MLYLTRDVKKILDKMIKRNKKYDKDIENQLKQIMTQPKFNKLNEGTKHNR